MPSFSPTAENATSAATPETTIAAETSDAAPSAATGSGAAESGATESIVATGQLTGVRDYVVKGCRPTPRVQANPVGVLVWWESDLLARKSKTLPLSCIVRFPIILGDFEARSALAFWLARKYFWIGVASPESAAGERSNDFDSGHISEPLQD
ncbi:MAG: hypothetical protein AAFY72_01175 [Cyanobacteria bacterium J06649_4]